MTDELSGCSYGVVLCKRESFRQKIIRQIPVTDQQKWRMTPIIMAKG